jgi:hypothetical protein
MPPSDASRGTPGALDGASHQARLDALDRAGASLHAEADLVARRSPTAVLDAGCGTGRVAIELDRRSPLVLMAGNVPLLTPPGTQAHLVDRRAPHLAPEGSSWPASGWTGATGLRARPPRRPPPGGRPRPRGPLRHLGRGPLVEGGDHAVSPHRRPA